MHIELLLLRRLTRQRLRCVPACACRVLCERVPPLSSSARLPEVWLCADENDVVRPGLHRADLTARIVDLSIDNPSSSGEHLRKLQLKRVGSLAFAVSNAQFEGVTLKRRTE